MESISINTLVSRIEKGNQEEIENLWNYFELLGYSGISRQSLKGIGGIPGPSSGLFKKKQNYYVTTRSSLNSVNILEIAIKIFLGDNRISINYTEYLGVNQNCKNTYLTSIILNDLVWIMLDMKETGITHVVRKDFRELLKGNPL